MINKALFLDRDGVINIDKGYVFKIEDFEFIEGIFELCLRAQSKGYLIIVVTNQSGIGRGYYGVKDFEKLTNWMIGVFEKHNISIQHVYYSPYHPEKGTGVYRRNSFCRKPNPGMLLQAKRDYGLDMLKSLLIGDKDSDIKAASNAGLVKAYKIKDGSHLKLLQYIDL